MTISTRGVSGITDSSLEGKGDADARLDCVERDGRDDRPICSMQECAGTAGSPTTAVDHHDGDLSAHPLVLDCPLPNDDAQAARTLESESSPTHRIQCRSRCRSTRRHKDRRPPFASPSAREALLDAHAPEVAARLRDEGVPQEQIRTVALELRRLVRFGPDEGHDVAYIRICPWSAELLTRYRDKVMCIFMKTRRRHAK